MAGEFERLRDSQERTKAAFATVVGKFTAFIQVLKDQLAQAPVGVLTAEQAAIVQTEMDSIEQTIENNPDPA